MLSPATNGWLSKGGKQRAFKQRGGYRKRCKRRCFMPGNALRNKIHPPLFHSIKMVQTYWEEVWGKGNLKAVADFYDPDAKHGENFLSKDFKKVEHSLKKLSPISKLLL